MRALLRLLVPHSWRVLLAVGLGAAVILSNMGLLAAAAYLVAAASITHLMAVLVIPMYAVRVLSATRGSTRYAERLVSHRITFDILARLRVRLYDRLRELGPAGMQGVASGDALGRAMADVEELQNAYLLFITPVAVACIVAIVCITVLLPFSPALAWTAAGGMILAGALVPLAVVVLTRVPGRETVLARAEANAHLVDLVQGNRDILSNGAEGRFLERTRACGRRTARAESRLAAVSATREGATELITNLTVLCALALAVPLVTRHALTSVYLTVPALLILAAFEGVRPLGQAAERLGSVRAAAGRVQRLGASLPVPETAGAVPVEAPCSISFQHVSLRYGGSARPALREVSFDIPAGWRVAVVGASGAGKTTLVHALTRAWEPASGRILLGAREIREYSLHALRSAIGVVSQDTYIFNDTVRNNLLLARPDAATSELEDALDAVGLLDVVRALPQGLDTWVGEHGERLSGGERQRLAVARIVLRDTPIVVLDEMTANLDPVTERALLETLYRITSGRTVMMVTHRLIELERMDEIVVLDRGRIVERGTHEQLVAAGGHYSRMLGVQDNMLIA